MKPGNPLSYILVLLGEILLIISFIYFGNSLDHDILFLDIVVGTIIYFLYFIDLIFSLIGFHDRSFKKIGSIGVKWFYTIMYTIIAIATMIYFNSTTTHIDFKTQLIVYSILTFFLLLGMYSALFVSGNIEVIFNDEMGLRNNLLQIKKLGSAIESDISENATFPPEIIKTIADLNENLKFVSPNNTIEAIELEKKILDEFNAIQNEIAQPTIDFEKMKVKITQIEKMYRQRKNSYSI